MTLAAYPVVREDEVGFRVQLTTAEIVVEIDTLIRALEALADAGESKRYDPVTLPG